MGVGVCGGCGVAEGAEGGRVADRLFVGQEPWEFWVANVLLGLVWSSIRVHKRFSVDKVFFSDASAFFLQRLISASDGFPVRGFSVSKKGCNISDLTGFGLDSSRKDLAASVDVVQCSV